MEKETKKQIAVYLTDDIAKALKKYCIDQEIAVTLLIESLIKEKLQSEKLI